MTAPTWQQKLTRDRDEVTRKLKNLVTFINSAEFITTDEKEQTLILEQRAVMTEHIRILNARIRGLVAKQS